MSPTTLLMIVLAVAPFATYGTMKVKHRIEIGAAVSAERNAGVQACNVRIADLGVKSREEAARRAKDGQEAASGVSATPQERAALVALCKASASCRDREQFR